MIDKITLKNRESGNDAFPYTWDSIVGRTGGTTVQDALDALEAGGAVPREGYKIVKTITDFTDANTTYEIRDDFDLGNNSISLPAGCILKFAGGSLNKGILVGNDTVIDAEPVTIFNKISPSSGDIPIIIEGTWNVVPYAEWFGDDIQECLDNFRSVHLRDRTYEVTSTIAMPYNSSIVGSQRSIIFASFYKGMSSGDTPYQLYRDTFPIFKMGVYSEVRNIQVHVDKPCEVFLVNSNHIGDTYYGRKEADEAYGRARKNGRDVIGWANDPRANKPAAGSIKVHVENVVISCAINYPTVASTVYVYENSEHAPEACCISLVSDGDYINRNGAFGGSFSDCVFRNIRIAGPWLYAVNVETGTYRRGDNDQFTGTKAPWLTDCTFEDFRIDNCYNVLRLWANDKSTNLVDGNTISTNGPGNLKFLNFSAQLQYLLAEAVNGINYGCVFADIRNCKTLYFDRCIPWDWKKSGYPSIIVYKIDRDNTENIIIKGLTNDTVPTLTGTGTNVPYTAEMDPFYGKQSLDSAAKYIDFYSYGTYRTTTDAPNVSGLAKLYQKVYGELPDDSVSLDAETLLNALPPSLGLNLQGYATIESTTWYCYKDSTNDNALTWTSTNPHMICKNKCFMAMPFGTFNFNVTTALCNYLKLDTTLLGTNGISQNVYGEKLPLGSTSIIKLYMKDKRIPGAELQLQRSSNIDPEGEIPNWVYKYADKKEYNTDTEGVEPLTAKQKMTSEGFYGPGQIHFLDRRLAHCKGSSTIYDVNGMNFNPISGDIDTKFAMLNPASGSSLVKLASIDTGKFFFDTSVKKPYWFDGQNWVSYKEAEVINTEGLWADKPALVPTGFQYKLSESVKFFNPTTGESDTVSSGTIVTYNGIRWLNGTTSYSYDFNLPDGIVISDFIPEHTAYPSSESDAWGTDSMYTGTGGRIGNSFKKEVITYRYHGGHFYRTSSSNYFVSDFFPVKEGLTITIKSLYGYTGQNTDFPVIVAFDDMPSSEEAESSSTDGANLIYAKSHFTNVEENGKTIDCVYTVPSGVKYIKFQFYYFYDVTSVSCSTQTARSTSGSSETRPTAIHLVDGELMGTLTTNDIGYRYYDTTLGIPIYAKAIDTSTGEVTWVDGTGHVPVTVTFALTHLTTSLYTPSVASVRQEYVGDLNADTGYSLPSSITVTMDGVELTDGVDYDYTPLTGSIEIHNVTGEIVITATGVAST